MNSASEASLVGMEHALTPERVTGHRGRRQFGAGGGESLIVYLLREARENEWPWSWLGFAKKEDDDVQG